MRDKIYKQPNIDDVESSNTVDASVLQQNKTGKKKKKTKNIYTLFHNWRANLSSSEKEQQVIPPAWKSQSNGAPQSTIAERKLLEGLK